MPQVRSEALVVKGFQDSANNTIATVPAGHRWLVKELRYLAGGSGGVLTVLFVTIPGVGQAQLDRRTLAADTPVSVPMSFVLEAGWSLQLYRNPAVGTVSILVLSGVDFELP